MKCRGPKCTNDGTLPNPHNSGEILCVSHYQQARRDPGRPLRPLRHGERERIPNVRVLPATLKALESYAKIGKRPLATQVAAVLDEWARRITA